jgi:hypothetical protein
MVCTEHGNVKSTKMSGAFEVSCNGVLIHSKLSVKEHGKCESALERRRVVEKLRRMTTIT